ncbi:MAG: hypothetical protein ACRCYY_20365 [Trueperaceae bacterium]
MRKYLCAFILCVLVSVGWAQELEAVNLLQDFSDLLQDACNELGVVGGVLENIPLGLEVPEELTWLCATVPSIDRAANLAQGFLNDVNGFTNQTMNDSLRKLGDAMGWQVGDTDVQTLIDDAMTNVQDGVFSAKGVAGQVLSQLHQAVLNRDDLTPANATEAEAEMADVLENTPSYTMQQLQSVEIHQDNILRSAQAVDVVSQAKTLAASAAARGDEQQLLLRVTNPAHAIPGNPGGTADEAEDAAFAAVSSRAAIQAGVEADADFMRQMATSTVNTTQALKEQAYQQTLTTQQLGLLVESIGEQNLLEYEKWEAEYYDNVVQATARGKEIEGNFDSVADLMSDEGAE